MIALAFLAIITALLVPYEPAERVEACDRCGRLYELPPNLCPSCFDRTMNERRALERGEAEHAKMIQGTLDEEDAPPEPDGEDDPEAPDEPPADATFHVPRRFRP